MQNHPRLVLGSDGFFRLVDGARPPFLVPDPFSSETPFLKDPRFDPTWRPMTAVRRLPERDAYGVFLYSSLHRDLREWDVGADGVFNGQRQLALAELGRFLSPDDIPQDLEFGPALLVADAFEQARRVAVKALRSRSAPLEALRFLIAAYASQGSFTRARLLLARLERMSAKQRSITGVSDDLSRSLFLQQFRSRRQAAAVLYLFQSPGALRTELSDAVLASGAEYVCLTYKRRLSQPRYIYEPGTTWSEGRNRLAEICKSRLVEYDYYVFCDDDVYFSNTDLAAGLTRFNELILSVRPEVATPATPWHVGWGGSPSASETSEADGFDAMFNAFRRDVLTEAILFPMIESLDHTTWYTSQSFMIHLCRLYYGVMRVNDLHVAGFEHSEYPKGPQSEQMARVFTLLTSHALPATSWPDRLRRFNRASFNVTLRDALQHRPVFPVSR